VASTPRQKDGEFFCKGSEANPHLHLPLSTQLRVAGKEPRKGVPFQLPIVEEGPGLGEAVTHEEGAAKAKALKNPFAREAEGSGMAGILL
jgi:hypothetical protein